MPKPSKIEFDIGQTIHGQPLRLVRGFSSSQPSDWTLCRDEANQRDDRVFITGLTTEHLRLLGDIARENP
jgi:hypothetical protein